MQRKIQLLMEGKIDSASAMYYYTKIRERPMAQRHLKPAHSLLPRTIPTLPRSYRRSDLAGRCSDCCQSTGRCCWCSSSIDAVEGTLAAVPPEVVISYKLGDNAYTDPRYFCDPAKAAAQYKQSYKHFADVAGGAPPNSDAASYAEFLNERWTNVMKEIPNLQALLEELLRGRRSGQERRCLPPSPGAGQVQGHRGADLGKPTDDLYLATPLRQLRSAVHHASGFRGPVSPPVATLRCSWWTNNSASASTDSIAAAGGQSI